MWGYMMRFKLQLVLEMADERALFGRIRKLNF